MWRQGEGCDLFSTFTVANHGLAPLFHFFNAEHTVHGQDQGFHAFKLVAHFFFSRIHNNGALFTKHQAGQFDKAPQVAVAQCRTATSTNARAAR